MKLGEWLEFNEQVCDGIGIHCRVFISEDADYGPIFEGNIDDIPWNLMKYRIGRCENDGEYYSDPPIFFVNCFHDDDGTVIEKPGFVICITGEEQ